METGSSMRFTLNAFLPAILFFCSCGQSIEEIEKQVVFSWLWDPASIGNLAYIALKSGHAELSARCSKQFERARQLSLEKPHLCEAWSVESARLATC